MALQTRKNGSMRFWGAIVPNLEESTNLAMHVGLENGDLKRQMFGFGHLQNHSNSRSVWRIRAAARRSEKSTASMVGAKKKMMNLANLWMTSSYISTK